MNEHHLTVHRDLCNETDYISVRLTRMMIDNGKAASFMRDKKGWLPAHVACNRHCSPEKLQMLLAANPGALFSKTDDGETLDSLARTSATKSHPNYALIEELNRQLGAVLAPQQPDFTSPVASLPATAVHVSSEDSDYNSRGRLSSNDSHELRASNSPSRKRSAKRRKLNIEDTTTPAALLLHFSRTGSHQQHAGGDTGGHDDDDGEAAAMPSNTAEV